MRDEYKPDRIISVGDFFDLNSFSRWPAIPDLHSPHDELELAIEAAQPWYKYFKDVDIVSSNHDARILRKAHAGGLPSRVLKEFGHIVESPKGWKWGALQIEVDGFTIVHGDAFNASSWKTGFNKVRTSVAIGHLHQNMGVCYSQSRKIRHWAMNTGCMIDMRQKAFDYARNTFERASLGMGFVIDGDQAFILPMPEKMQKDFKK